MKQALFVSSVQKELATERKAIRDFVRSNRLLNQFFDVFLFEELPASDRLAEDVYLKQVNRCGIYLGLFGNEYGFENAGGLSATEREFDHATVAGKPRLIFVKGDNDAVRQPQMAALIRKAGSQLIRRRFSSIQDLTDAVYASLVEHLERSGVIQTQPFEERTCRDGVLNDIDHEAVMTFLRRAHNERQFPLAEDTPIADVLTHLHLLVDGQVSNAAMLLFCRNPQRFFPCAEVRCMHFHGTEIQRPVPFYRVFKGNLFEQVDNAVDFVLSKVNRSVGTRAQGTRAPVQYELPEDVVAEAIVNAMVHRDYASSAAIQVSVFADRVEVWNPGELLPPLTPESLRKPHRSILRNPRIAEALFLAHYIEKYGTGTLMMIRESLEYSLPEPRFGVQSPGEFGATIWRDWLTKEVLAKMRLNDRQLKAIEYLKVHGRISNPDYRKVSGSSKQTGSRDLDQLCEQQVLSRIGSTGKGTYYVLKINGLTMGSMGSRKVRRGAVVGIKAGLDIVADLPNSALVSNKKNCKNTFKTTKIKRVKGSKKNQGSHSSSIVTRNGGTKSAPSRRKVTEQVTEQVIKLLKCLKVGALGGREVMRHLKLRHRPTFIYDYLEPALSRNLIKMTQPDSPNSPTQKYSLTKKGKSLRGYK